VANDGFGTDDFSLRLFKSSWFGFESEKPQCFQGFNDFQTSSNQPVLNVDKDVLWLDSDKAGDEGE